MHCASDDGDRDPWSAASGASRVLDLGASMDNNNNFFTPVYLVAARSFDL